MTVSARGAARAAGVITAVAVLGGCGAAEQPRADTLPLAPTVRLLAQAYNCPTVPSVCFRYLLLAGGPGAKPDRLKAAEVETLMARGWRRTEGVTARQAAARSPDGKVFVSFATGADERADERAGHVAWNGKLGARLSTMVAHHRAVLAVTLEPGTPK